MSNRITDIASRRQDHGWDGYDAEPISALSVSFAIRLAKLLGDIWDIVPEPDGLIGFEWRAVGKIFTISVGEDGMLYYSYIAAGTQRYGSVLFTDGIPAVISDCLSHFKHE